MKKKRFWIVVAVIVLIMFTQCKFKSRYKGSKDSLDILLFNKSIENSFSQQEMPYRYFIRGWREKGDGKFYLINSVGEVVLPDKGIKGMEFEAVTEENYDNVIITIKKEHETLKRITVTSNPKKFTISVKPDFLGKTIRFVVSNVKAVKGAIITVGKVRFKSTIETENFHLKKYIQKVNTKIPYFYTKDDGIRYIKVEFDKPNNKKSFFIIYGTVENNSKILKKVEISNKKKYKIFLDKLPQPNDGTNIVRLDFEVTGEAGARVYWRSFYVKKEKNDFFQKKVNLQFIRKKPKKIFYIILDAFRADLLYKKVEGKEITPFLNSFSGNCYNFINFFSAAPYTRASVSTIFSGLLPETHGVREKNSQYWNKLPDIVNTFKNNGYKTWVIYGTRVLPVNNLSSHFDEKVYIRNFKKIIVRNFSTMRLNLIRRKIKEIKKEEKAFVYIHLLPPHEPYNPPEPFNTIFVETGRIYNNMAMIKMVNRINYFEQVNLDFLNFLKKAYLNNANYADSLVKGIINALKRNRIYNDSLIIISSDHGEAFFEHRKIGHNSTNYNEMIKVPFLVRFPYQKKKFVIRAYKSTVDVFPTLIDLMGLKRIDTKIKYQGESFISCFVDERCDDDRFVYSRTDDPRYSYSIIWHGFKYINYLGRDELYNLKDDPEEKVNIFNEFPIVTNYLRQKGFEIMKENTKLRKMYNIPKKNKKLTKEDIKHLKSLGYL